MFNLILFGPPGSGKGTQSEKIIEKYKLVHLSTGDLLRSQIAKQTALGLEAKKLMSKGQLVPDEVVVGMISSCVEQDMDAAGFLFDGFPRTESQAQSLDALLKQKNETINLFIGLDVSEKEITDRLMKRGATSNRPDDSDPAIIAKRISVYKTETESVADHYKKFDKVVMIAGEGSIEDIFKRICKEIDSRL
ncbi:MAG: adenylate kinase [Ferruginibacter sp.]